MVDSGAIKTTEVVVTEIYGLKKADISFNWKSSCMATNPLKAHMFLGLYTSMATNSYILRP